MSPAQRTSRGPSRETFWRRRLLAVAVVFLVVWVAVQLLKDDPEPTGGQAKPTTTVTTTTPATQSVAPEAPKPKGGATVAKVAVGTGNCEIDKIVIKPAVPVNQFAGGVVKLNLNVSTTATTPCTLTPDKSKLVAIIRSNDSAVWDSSVCKSSLLTQPVSVAPGWTTVVPAAWSGRGSGTNCSPGNAFSSQGTYVLRVATLGGEPSGTEFRLLKKPKPKPVAPSSTTTPVAPPATPTPAAPTTPTD